MTQCEAILAHLRAGHSITPAQAYERFGCLALHSRAAELRSRGHDVVCQIRTRGTQRWGEYFLMP